MSTTEFNKLFAAYPTNEHVNGLRSRLHLALVQIFPQLERASADLAKATLDYRQPVQDAAFLLDEVMRLGYGLPVVAQMLYDLRAPAMAAIQTYNTAAQKRRGLLLRTNQVTQQEFDDCTNAINKALCDIATWVQTVTPGA